ncbi:hypothetical protein [Taibaiella soli]|uniref:Uncharacterized protein n=1 Tax=Taibaiella soli TaxID=1649169 RepID=A0A2W2A8X6_9BACT|nr:hypothetical protein [Taibaiella soli]PZF71765.1 hypothetical protein DN068_17010 [Taibaiella soli]
MAITKKSTSTTKRATKSVAPMSEEKFIIVHLTQSKTGASVMNSKGFATAVKLEQHVKSLIAKSKK